MIGSARRIMNVTTQTSYLIPECEGVGSKSPPSFHSEDSFCRYAPIRRLLLRHAHGEDHGCSQMTGKVAFQRTAPA
jgi:hypothetical protein